MRPVIVVPQVHRHCTGIDAHITCLQVVIGAFGKFQTLPRYVDATGNPASTDEIYRY